jgi:tetratricopeptide (TPR) repeat protein
MSFMDSFFKPALKYLLIVTVTLAMGFSVWLLPHDKKEEAESITSPIDAKDLAGRYLQQASEDFFYHEFDRAIENYGKAIAAFEKENQLQKAAKVYESIGDLYKFRRNLKAAEAQYILAMSYHHKINNPLGEAGAMNHAGDLFMERGENVAAGAWYKKGVELVKDLPAHQTQALLFENIGRFYWKTEKNIPQAIIWYTRARDTFSTLENQMGYDHMSAVLNKLRGGQNLNTH